MSILNYEEMTLESDTFQAARETFNPVSYTQLFPETVSEVIYEKWQFTPVANGRFQKVEPNKECFEALQMIVSEKWDGSLGATYFESESSSTWHRDNLHYLYSHGGHDFYIDREE